MSPAGTNPPAASRGTPVESWTATILLDVPPLPGTSDASAADAGTRQARREQATAALWAAEALAVTDGRHAASGVFAAPAPVIAPWPAASITWTRQPPTDHMAAWHAHATSVAAGAFELVPSHRVDDQPTASGLHRIVLDAGMAFGTGHHATTAGCLTVLTDMAADVSGARVVDVGTGTGVLAIAAAMSGAAQVAGVDTDPAAVEVARTNCRTNDVDVSLAVGSTDLLLQHDDGPLAGSWDIVLANLLTGLLVELAQDLWRLTAPGGLLVASGTSVDRAPRVVAALDAAGFQHVQVTAFDDWAVLTARRSEQTDPGQATCDVVGAEAKPTDDGPDTTNGQDPDETRWPPHLHDGQ